MTHQKLFFVLICFSLLFVASFSIVSAQSAIQTTVQINAGANDVNEDASSFQPGLSPQWLGTSSSVSNSYAGYRFVNLTVPKGATIQTASIQVYSTQSQWLNVSYVLSAHASGNSPAFSASSKPSGRVQTTAKITSSTNVQWNTNSWYALPNMASVIQEVVSRSDWQSGNAVSILLKGTGNAWGRKFVRAYEASASQAPKLTVTYLPPPTPTPTPTPIPTYEVSGTIFVDLDGNGTQNIGETAYTSGSLISLSGFSSASQTTNGSGEYSFANLYAGNYTLSLTIPAGYMATTQNPKSLMVSGNTVQYFGIRPLYVISGSVFEDLNGDGIQDTGEAGYADVALELAGPSAQSVQSSSTGAFIFENLITGQYTIELMPPFGYQVTTTPHPASVNLSQNQTIPLGIQQIPTPTPEPTPTPTPLPTPDIADYYVSPTGSDSQSGSINEPFKTIQKATNATKTDTKLGATIHVLGGIYRESVSLSNVNGTPESPVTIQAEEGANTVFVYGSESSRDPRITWLPATESAQFIESARPNLYVANISIWNGTPELAYQTSQTTTRLPKAREPDWGVTTQWKYHENWWKAEAKEPLTQNTLIDDLDDSAGSYPEASASAGNLKFINGAPASSLVGGRIFLKDTVDGHDSFSARIIDHDATISGKITLDENLVHYSGNSAVGPYAKYFVEGAPQLLDQPGEWYYDAATRNLYLWPPEAASPSTLDLEFAIRNNAFSINKSSYVTLKNLNLQFTNFTYSGVTGQDGAIRFFGFSNDITKNIFFDGLKVLYNGVGLRLYQSNASSASPGRLSYVTVKNSTIAYADSYGMVVWPFPRTPPQEPVINNLWLENNEFGNLGFRGDGPGIFMQYPEKIVLLNNYFHDSAHNNVDIQQGKATGNSYIYVANNLFENSCYNGSDCGGLKLLHANGGTGMNVNLVSNNIFRGTKGWSYANEAQNKFNSTLGYGYFGFGYYSDVALGASPELGCSVILYRNIIQGNSADGIHFTRSRDQCAFNNVITQNGVGIQMNNFGPTIDGSFNNILRGNIIQSTEPENPTAAKIFGISARLNQSDEGKLEVNQNIYQLSGPRAFDMYKQDISYTNVGQFATVPQIQASTPWEDDGRDTVGAAIGITSESSYDISSIESAFGISSVSIPAEANGTIAALNAEFGLNIANQTNVGRIP